MAYDIEEKILYIFTDGASRKVFNEKFKRKSGRFGGKGIRFVYYDENLNLMEENESDNISYVGATNNDMELQASVDGLKIALDRDLNRFSRIKVVTDSQFVSENVYNAQYVRPLNKWIGKVGEPITQVKERKELVKYKNKIYEKFRKNVYFDWVKGHEDNEFNKKADKSAVEGARSPIRKLGSNAIVRSRFLKSKPGQVKTEGQEMLIHIIVTRRLKKQKINKYKYEVVSWDSPYFSLTNDAYYEGYLSAEKIYKVQFGEDERNRFIVDVISTEEKEDIRESMINAGVSMDVFFGKPKKEEKAD